MPTSDDDPAERRDRAADEREELAERREAAADRRDQFAADMEWKLTATDEDAAVHADLARNASSRRANQRAREQQRARAALTGAPQGDEAGDHPWARARREFIADDREEQADRREVLADERERLADERAVVLDRTVRTGRGGVTTRAEPPGAAEARAIAGAARDADHRQRARAATQRAAAPPGPLARELVEISQLLFHGADAEAAFARIVLAAARTMEGCDEASLSQCSQGDVRTVASTSTVADRLDQLQYDIGEGPCLQAIAVQETVRADDLSLDGRWPAFAPAASAWVRSVLSCPMNDLAEQQVIGSLNSYGVARGSFGRADEDTAMLLTAHLGAALSFAARVEGSDARLVQLSDAIETRDVIGQAKGILMERQRLTADQAFDVLRRASQSLNRKLRDVAEDVAATGEVPTRQL